MHFLNDEFITENFEKRSVSKAAIKFGFWRVLEQSRPAPIIAP